jgi:hypothetical protein
MVDYALVDRPRIAGDRNEHRTDGERRSGEERRRGERREPFRTSERRAVEPLRAIVPEALDFVTPWQIAQPMP